MSIQVKRRDFLKAAGIGAGAAAVGYGLATGQQTAQAAPALPTLVKAATPLERNRAWHILNRISFGPRPGQVDELLNMGLTAYIKRQLNPASINDDEVNKRLGKYNTLNMNVRQLRTSGPEGKEVQNIDQQLVEATMIRAAYSQRQLFEVMCLFWSEHFSIQHAKGWCYMLKTIDDREVIRKYALGSFKDLLMASAKSPAMLNYLDNASSSKEHPNENYAREILELHTLGIGNYTEKDIKELSRCLTGWSIEYDDKKPNHGEFAYKKYMHDDGAKTVLGVNIPAGGGIKDGETMVAFLATHPKTARFISTKLCRRFVGDQPSERIIQKATDTFLKTGGDIPSVLTAIFSAEEFWYAPPKYKRPFEYLLSLFRALNITTIENWWGPSRDLDVLGHKPFAHPTPDGYSDFATPWVNGIMLDRWNMGINYTREKGKTGQGEDIIQLAVKNGAKETPQDVLNYYAQLMLGRTLKQAETDVLLKHVSTTGKMDLKTGRESVIEAIALIANSPAYQYR